MPMGHFQHQGFWRRRGHQILLRLECCLVSSFLPLFFGNRKVLSQQFIGSNMFEFLGGLWFYNSRTLLSKVKRISTGSMSSNKLPSVAEDLIHFRLYQVNQNAYMRFGNTCKRESLRSQEEDDEEEEEEEDST